MDKDEILTSFAVIILLFTALIDWNLYSWFILVGIIFILFAWYFKKTEKLKQTA
jgi:Ca2+/Na+ antiporter